MLKLGRGVGREAVRKALAGRAPLSVTYEDVLDGEAIREALAGIREAGTPAAALPLLSWLASHPNAPEDVLRDLHSCGGRGVLLSLCLNRNLPADVRKDLLNHEDDEVRVHANHVLCRTRKH